MPNPECYEWEEERQANERKAATKTAKCWRCTDTGEAAVVAEGWSLDQLLALAEENGLLPCPCREPAARVEPLQEAKELLSPHGLHPYHVGGDVYAVDARHFVYRFGQIEWEWLKKVLQARATPGRE
jgi:hypothetical protein